MTTALKCQNLKKVYKSRKEVVEAVNGLDLEIATGECFGLLGPNGAGKTTTMEILEGLLEPTQGEVEILGKTWRQDESFIRERIGISLQETKLSDKLTVQETLQLFRSFYSNGITPEEAIRKVSLQEKANTWLVRLSGGQRQRLAVATALVGDPELLFLDEPTTGLDPQSRRQLWDIIREFRSQNRTVVLTTHYMDEAEKLCDRVAIVDHGKVIALGSPQALIAKLGGEHVIDFTLANDQEIDAKVLEQLPSIRSVRIVDHHHQLTINEPHVALPALLNYLQNNRFELVGLSTRHATLEDVFVNLTGRHLRDDETNK